MSNPALWEDIRKLLPDNAFIGMVPRDHPNSRLLVEPKLKAAVQEGREFFYLDNVYFPVALAQKAWRRTLGRALPNAGFRLIRNGFHVTKLQNVPDDRRKKLCREELKPWRSGRDVIVIPPSIYFQDIYGSHGWTDATVAKLQTQTDRPIRVKYQKSIALRDWLADAHCMVTYGSAACVESILSGVPVFAGPICPALPITAGDDIEKPIYHDREPWLNSLAYAQWNLEELRDMDLTEYQCG